MSDEYVSILPSEAEVMTDLPPRPDDFDFTIADMTYETVTNAFDGAEVLAIAVTFTLDGENEGFDVGDTYTEALKLGGKSISYFDIAGNGKLLKSKPGVSKGLSDKCSGIKFINSLVQHGFPEVKISEKKMHLDVFVGTKGHALRVGTGFEYNNKQGDKVEAKALLVTDIYSLPWEDAKPAKAAAKAKGNGAAAKETEDVDSLAELTLVDILSVQDGPIARVRAGVLVSQAFAKTDPNMAKALSRKVADKSFVGGLNSVVYDATKDTLVVA